MTGLYEESWHGMLKCTLGHCGNGVYDAHVLYHAPGNLGAAWCGVGEIDALLSSYKCMGWVASFAEKERMLGVTDNASA